MDVLNGRFFVMVGNSFLGGYSDIDENSQLKVYNPALVDLPFHATLIIGKASAERLAVTTLLAGLPLSDYGIVRVVDKYQVQDRCYDCKNVIPRDQHSHYLPVIGDLEAPHCVSCYLKNIEK